MSKAAAVGTALCLYFTWILMPAAAQTPSRATPAAATDSTALPPRSIRDIEALLKSIKARETGKNAASEYLALADRAAPTTTDAGELARFFRARSEAAGQVGRDGQAVEDMRKALEYARKANITLKDFQQKLANAEVFVGNFTTAMRLLQEKLRDLGPSLDGRFGPLSMLAVLHVIMGDLKKAQLYQNDAEASLKEVESRPDWRKSLPAVRAQVFRSRAQVLEGSGRLAEAEAAYRATLSSYEQFLKDAAAAPALAAGWTQGSLHGFLDASTASVGLVLMRQGRLAEAEVEIRRALANTLGRRSGLGAFVANRVGDLTAVLIEQGRFVEAEILAREEEPILVDVAGRVEAGNVSRARLRVAQALAFRGKPRRAGEIVASVLAMKDNDPVQLLRVVSFDPILLTSLARARKTAEAEVAARAFLDTRQRALGEKAYGTAEARGFLGAVLWMGGKKDEALAAFHQAVPVLLAESARSEDQIAKGVRFQTILEAYLALLFELKGTPALAGIDITAETFRLAEAARARGVQRAIAASAARAAARDPTLTALVRREQDLGQRVVGLYQTLVESAALPADQQAPGAQAALREEIDRATSARAAITKDIVKRFPDYAELIDPKPVTLPAARAALKPGETLVTFLVGVEQSYVWAVPFQGEATVAVVRQGEAEVTEIVAKLRRSLDPQAQKLSDIPAFDVATAHALYRDFLGPVASALGPTKSLLVVPHGPLGQLPVALLVTEPPPALKPTPLAFAEYRPVAWFVRRMAVTQLPSVATFTALRKLPPGKPDRWPLIAFGDPIFAPNPAGAVTPDLGKVTLRGQRIVLRSAPQTADLNSADLSNLPRLPDTADEIRSIAVTLGADVDRDLFLGARATEENVMNADLPKRRVVMFATHGLVPGDLDGLTQPALALSSPKVVGGKGNGLLTLEKVLSLKLDADWVVLSACNTASASGTEGAGAEALSGLARAFFYAGARTMLVSNWPVESTSATAITTGLFKRQSTDPSLSRAEALRQSMLAAIDQGVQTDHAGKPSFAYAHPILWAPFSLVGDGWSSGIAN